MGSIRIRKRRSLSSKGQTSLGIDMSRLPSHVAIVMDGNGRWAGQRLMNRIKGHEKGADTVREIVRTCCEIGVQVLTLYAFSTENWKRPKLEVTALMALLKKFLASELDELTENDIRLNGIGQIERLPEDVRHQLNVVMDRTRQNKGMLLNLALSYGGRSEIVRMVQHVAADAAAGRMDPDAVTSETVSRYLYTAGMPDPDMMIRTSGEMRISNFLLWQIAYTEIFVTETLWPDFSREEFLDMVAEYQRRERRFGKVNS